VEGIVKEDGLHAPSERLPFPTLILTVTNNPQSNSGYNIHVPKLTQYKPLEPFSMDELVEAANVLMRGKSQAPISSRTVRYYVSEGILPPPRGAPKVARYSYNHLVRLLGAKVLQEGGLRLNAINAGIEAWNKSSPISLEEMIQRWLDGEELVIAAPNMMEDKSNPPSRSFQSEKVQEQRAHFNVLSRSPGDIVRRIPLTSLVTLEISGNAELERELPRAMKALEKLIQEIS
jgi:DNA-binding transcriptional MerR regulator